MPSIKRISRRGKYYTVLFSDSGKILGLRKYKPRAKVKDFKITEKIRKEIKVSRISRKSKIPTSIKKVKKKDISYSKKFKNITNYWTRKPIKGKKGQLYVKFRFIKYFKGRTLKKDAVGWSDKINFPSGYNKAYTQCLNRARHQANFSPDDVIELERNFSYYASNNSRLFR